MINEGGCAWRSLKLEACNPTSNLYSTVVLEIQLEIPYYVTFYFPISLC